MRVVNQIWRRKTPFFEEVLEGLKENSEPTERKEMYEQKVKQVIGSKLQCKDGFCCCLSTPTSFSHFPPSNL